jgi:hypothetical protein
VMWRSGMSGVEERGKTNLDPPASQLLPASPPASQLLPSLQHVCQVSALKINGSTITTTAVQYSGIMYNVPCTSIKQTPLSMGPASEKNMSARLP